MCAAHKLPEDHSYPHTNLPSSFLADLCHALRPSYLVEIGSFKGGSALRIADAAVAATTDAELPCLVCVDTFLGDAGMWLNRTDGARRALLLEHGLPSLYFQFLANTLRQQYVILPLPLASLCALRALQHLAADGTTPQPDFIYLDASHEKGETVLEMTQAFRLLRAGGVLVGDDLDWPAVSSDAQPTP